MKFINPNLFKKEDMPIIVFSNNDTDLFPYLIRWRTKSSYNHVMWLYEPGTLASQGLLYNKVPLEKYLKAGNRLEFWKLRVGKPVKNMLINKLTYDLKAPFYERFYNFPGIVGQILGLRWISSTITKFCSDRVGEDMQFIDPSIPQNASPEMLRDYFISKPEMYEKIGYWWEDL